MVLVTDIDEKVYWYIVHFYETNYPYTSYENFKKTFYTTIFHGLKSEFLNLDKIDHELDNFLMNSTEQLLEIMKNRLMYVDGIYTDDDEYNYKGEDEDEPSNLFCDDFVDLTNAMIKLFCSSWICDDYSYSYLGSYLMKCVKTKIENTLQLTKSATKL